MVNFSTYHERFMTVTAAFAQRVLPFHAHISQRKELSNQGVLDQTNSSPETSTLQTSEQAHATQPQSMTPKSHFADDHDGAWHEHRCHHAFATCALSPREFEVAVCAYRGFTAKTSAHTLCVSESTVKTHLTALYRKVGVRSKQELIAHIDASCSK